MKNIWRNHIAKWIAYKLPYSIVCWCGVRMLRRANIVQNPDMLWSHVMDVWEEQEGK